MPLTRTAKRRLLLALALLGPVALLKGWMAFGPTWPERWAGWKDAVGISSPQVKASPAVFPWHARLVLRADLGFPRRLEGYLPAPVEGSTAALQLKGMGLWDGRAWTPVALALGPAEGRGLRVGLGVLDLDHVADISPSRDYNGPELCQVDYWVRWDLDGPGADLVRVERLIGLRRPVGLSITEPGGQADQQLTLERAGLGWRVWRTEQAGTLVPGRPARGKAWLGLFL